MIGYKARGLGYQMQLLEPKEVINERWKVVGRLGGGGFGDVFIGWDRQEEVDVAIKAEDKEDSRESLRMEVGVLKRLQGKKHAAKFYGCGQTLRAQYMVMQLLSKSLSELRRGMNGAKFSSSTTYRICCQALQAIQEVHSIGFLHRDVKASNFSMGISVEDYRTLFILDFGLCRQYMDGAGRLLRPRKFCPFRGTIRYCSIRAHEREEQGRADDIESLLYMMIEMAKGSLPWRKLTEKDEVKKKKKQEIIENLCQGLPQQILQFGRHVKKVPWLGAPDYDLLEGYLRAAAFDMSGVESWDDKYDWESNSDSEHTKDRTMSNSTQRTQSDSI